MGDSHVGLHARLMSQAMRKMTGIVSKSKTALIFINQIREKIGVMFGNPETTTGGRALKFYASMRLDIRRIGAIKNGDETIGNRTKLKVVKNKVAPPFRVAEFDILYGEGVSREGDLLDLGVAHKIVEKSGSWFSCDNLRLGQGRENARLFLKDNPDLAKEIDAKLRVALGLTKEKKAAAEASAEATGGKPEASPAKGRDAKPTAGSGRSGADRARGRSPRAPVA
jgi:recombination protein RecA